MHRLLIMRNQTPNKIFNALSFLAFLLFFTACASREDLVYFQGERENIENLYNKYTPKLQPDDLLTITIYAKDPEALKMISQSSVFNESGNEFRKLSYLIDENGDIDFPTLGKIKLGGMTRSEAMTHMKSLLAKYIVEPDVNIQLSNFKITVLGEVTKPGSFTLQNERITILEAIGMAGDLTINGVRKNVLVVREEAGEKSFHRVDLTTNEIFNSPVYFLAQNDVVYVEPNKAQINSSTYSRNTSVIIAVAGLAISVISVLIRVF